MADPARLTRLSVDALTVLDDPEARITLAAVETMTVADNPQARLSRASVEVLYLLGPEFVPVALNATVTHTANHVGLVGRVQALTTLITNTAKRSRYFMRSHLASVGVSTNRVNQVGKVMQPAPVTHTASQSLVSVFGKLLSVGLSAGATFKRDFERRINASIDTTGSVLRTLAMSVATAFAVTSALSSAKVLRQALTVGLTSSASWSRAFTRNQVATITASPVVVRSLVKSLIVGVTGTALLDKARTVPIAIAAQVGIATSMIKGHARELAAGFTGTTGFVRDFSKNLSASVAISINIRRSYLQTLVASLELNATLMRLRGYTQAITASFTTVATLVGLYSDVVARNVIRAKAFVGRSALRALARLGIYGDDQ